MAANIVSCVQYSRSKSKMSMSNIHCKLRRTAALQRDLNALIHWSKKNHLLFNLQKCEKITLTKKNKNEMKTTYTMDTDHVKDLGVVIDKKNYYFEVKNTMGFIIRNSKNFKSVHTLKILYMHTSDPHVICNVSVEPHLVNIIYECYRKHTETLFKVSILCGVSVLLIRCQLR